jgi:hypothetical protein
MLNIYDTIVDQLVNPWISLHTVNPPPNSILKSSYKLPNVHAPTKLDMPKKMVMLNK